MSTEDVAKKFVEELAPKKRVIVSKKLPSIYGKVIIGACWIVLLALMGFCLFLTFRNPDMTSTRLFLTYWKECIFCVVLTWFTLVLRSKAEAM